MQSICHLGLDSIPQIPHRLHHSQLGERSPRRLLKRDKVRQWARLYAQQIGETWAAMIVADEALRPEPGSLKGTSFFGETRRRRRSRRVLTCWGPS